MKGIRDGVETSVEKAERRPYRRELSDDDIRRRQRGMACQLATSDHSLDEIGRIFGKSKTWASELLEPLRAEVKRGED